jgi:hypothetical protein
MKCKREEAQMKRLLVLFALEFLLLGHSHAQQFPHIQPAMPGDFAIMAWDNAPSDSALLEGIKDAGMNIAGFCKAEDVDRIQAAGLTCFLQDPQLSNYNWDAPPAEESVRKDVGALAHSFGDNPAVLGVFLTDEPRIHQMPAIGRVVQLLREAMPGKLPYVNLFPYREGEVGWYTNYEDYVNSLIKAVHEPFLSFDNYSLSYEGMGDEFFTNLEIVRKTGLESKTPFWSCIQAVAHFGYLVPSDATLHLQVYSTLAYGGRGIQYFTYFTPQRGNYRMGAIDQFGHRTPTWDALRRINGEINALAPTLAKLRSTGVYHYPDVPKHGRPLSESGLVRWISMVKDEDGYVPPSVEARFLIGEFENENGGTYMMIVNKDLTYSFRFDIEFKRKVHRILRINPYTGQEEPFTGEQNWLAPGGGILLRIE